MSNEKKFEFKVGDVVEWGGVRGKVYAGLSSLVHPVMCEFENETVASFTYDGKYMDWHKEPSLKLIERPKKKVKKYKVLYRDTYNNYFVSSGFYENRIHFDLYTGNMQFIQLIKESEIEVEEKE